MKVRALCLLLIFAAHAFARDVDVGRLSAVVKKEAEGDKFMGTVLVAKDDGVVFEMSSGWANAEWKIPNSRSTKFRLGSVTKQFTAAAILLLEERGKLKIDDPIAHYFNGIPDAWRPITIRHLLTHTSGIADFTRLPGYTKGKLLGLSPAQTMELVRNEPLEFSPGSSYGYSNTDYVLLGWIVELASGQSYREFLKTNIFTPLGMANSGYDSTLAIIPQRASGYVSGALGLRNANYIDMRTPAGAGGLYSTAGDLLKWTTGLFGGKLLPAVALEQMTVPWKAGSAFGMFVGIKNGRKRFSHAGGIDGFSSWLSYYPESRVSIVVLSNVEGPSAPRLSEELEEAYFGEEVAPHSDS